MSLPTHVADDVLDRAAGATRGFGSVRVEATLGATVWRTSVFPDSASKTYVLPIKKAVRHAEGIEAGDSAHLQLRLLDV